MEDALKERIGNPDPPNESIKHIPYGESNYEALRKENAYYVDKTMYIREIEKTGKYLFFIRPRRFGKSLFLSTMENYYDIDKKDQFEILFKGTDIFNSPTPEKNAYLIFKCNFSAINPDPMYLERSSYGYVSDAARLFISEYHHLLHIDKEKEIEKLEARKSGSDILNHIIFLCRDAKQKCYVLIDEYDNFANTILSNAGKDSYKQLTRGEGFFRAFFNVLKEGTTGSNAPISRIFVTGVSPITLDDVTSGYNIGRNISTIPIFNEMLGFRKSDVLEMLHYYREAGLIRHDPEELMGILDRWYNNYRFSSSAQETVYNTDMVLYFFNEYFTASSIPEELIDRNVRTDYGKLRHLVIIDRDGQKKINGNFSRLQEIVETGRVESRLVQGFPVEEMETQENFISLLFYLGLLSIEGKKEGLTVFKIPNLVIKSLYFDYIVKVIRDTRLIELNTAKLDTLLHEMAYRGKWEDFFAYIAERMNASTSIRDYIREEKVIQGFLLAYLGMSNYFIVYSEKELNKGFGDITMEPFLTGYKDISYSYILEIKYIPRDEAKKPRSLAASIKKLKIQAEEQLRHYVLDERFQKSIGKTELMKLVLIFHGHELVYSGISNE
ncbi:MAG: AAA family ATPase [Candidatus Omnitrophota bacterium]